MSLIVAGACGGGSDESAPTTAPPAQSAPESTDEPVADPTTTPPASTAPATSPPTTAPSEPAAGAVFSDDGDLGVAGGNADVSARLLDPADWPAELAGADASASNVKVYELEPDGAEFDSPVTVQRRLDIASFDGLDLGPGDVPLVTMLTQNDRGEYELLDDLTIMRAGPHLFVSGTTDHFSPIIVANENRMIPWGPGEGDAGIEPAEASDFLTEILSADGPLGPVGPVELPLWTDTPHGDYLSAAETVDVLRRIVAEGITPTDGAFVLPDGDGMPVPSEPAPVLDGPTLEDAGDRARRFGTSFPGVPISLAPSAAALLEDPDVAFDLTVQAIELVLTDEEYRALGSKVADDLVDELGPLAFGVTETQFVNEVFHRVFGAYPSEILLSFAEVVVLASHTLYAFSWQGGEPTADTPIVDIREATITPDGATASLGLECYCVYQHGLIAVEGELDPELLDTNNGPMVWELIANDPDVQAVALTNQDGTLFESTITADEGRLYEGVVLLRPLLAQE